MTMEFCRWEWASLLFLVYTFVCALLLRGLTPSARLKSASGSAVGIGVVCASAFLTPHGMAWRFLVLPALVLFIAYRSSGLLFRTPSPRVEAFLFEVDRALRIRQTASAAARPAAELLEFAYAAVYALIPIALAMHYVVTPSARIDSDRFWTVVLVTDFVCFACLPWIQSRPPRTLEADEPWRSAFRRLNQRVVGAASIQVNTCPSGHAAEAVAAALLVSNAPAPVVTGMVFAALAVSAGAVYGRYHYAVDAISGWAVALVVWVLIWR
jgi:PAP2 superfamily